MDFPCARALLVVDWRVPDAQVLLAGVDPALDVLYLDRDRDGLEQISNAVRGMSGIPALHVLSHGSEATLYLGNSVLNPETLPEYESELCQIGGALRDGGDILLYGCSVAAGERGRSFIRSLAELTGADVCASRNRTGSAALGGDWLFEEAVGKIDAAPPFGERAMAGYRHVLTHDESGTSGVLRPDGKILITGYSHIATYDFALWLYNADGTLDTSFGTGGRITTDIGGSTYDVGRGVVLQSDDKIVVVGEIADSPLVFALVRYNADGSLDTSFGGGDGKVTTDFPNASGPDGAQSVVLQDDGKIIAAGYANDPGISFTSRFGLARYNPDGSLDTSFDGDGMVITSFGGGGGSSASAVYALAVLPDGKIVAGGSRALDNRYDFALARYNPDGSLDTSFGDGGLVSTAIGAEDDIGYAMALQDDGKIVMSGYSWAGSLAFTDNVFAVVRYNADGSLDTSFGTGGKVTTPIGTHGNPGGPGSSSVVLQDDGKIVVAGQALDGGDIDFALVRYNTDGSLDTTFDGDGILLIKLGPGEDIPLDLVKQADGSIVAVGSTQTGTGLGIGLVIIGTEGDDVLEGGVGDDTVIAFAGDDTLTGADGDDLLDGGVGDNIVQGDAGSDVALLSGTLADYAVSILSPGSGGQTFYDPGFGLQPGDIVNLVNQTGRIDRLAGVEKVRFVGNPSTEADDVELELTPAGLLAAAALNFGQNYLADSTVANSLVGGSGNDVLDGLSGPDTLEGAGGNDVLLGGAGNDSLEGGENNDALNGGAGNDTLVGGPGNDNYIVDSLGDQIVESPGEGSTDRVQTLLTLYSLEGLPEVEILQFTGEGDFHGIGNAAANVLIGTTGADLLEANAGDDSLIGASGNDTLAGGDGNDTLDGGTGNDLVSLSADREDYVFQGEAGNASATHGSSGELDQLLNVERVRFGDGEEASLGDLLLNVITGTNDDDTMIGTAGDDSLIGGAGNDSLVGEAGDDVLNGGVGNDAAGFSGSSSGYDFSLISGNVVVTDTDTISGGNDGADTLIGIEAASFTDGTVRIIAAAPEFRVNTTTSGSQDYSAIAALSDGGFVVTWGPGGSSPGGVHAQRYDAGGAAVGSEFQVNTTSANWENYAAIAALSDGGFVVTWNSDGQDGSGPGIYAQRYDASGAASGAEFQVNSTTANEQAVADVAALSDGGYVVAWTSQGTDGNGWGIYAQRYDDSGAAVGSEFRVNTTTANNEFYPSIAALSGGGFVVTWTSFADPNGDADVYAQRYGANGTASGVEFKVNSTTENSESTEDVAALAGGGFVVTWQSFLLDGSNSEIYAQRYEASGVAAGAQFRVNTTTASWQTEPTVAALSDGGFVVTWQSYFEDSSYYRGHAQRFDASGAAIGPEIQFNTTTEFGQSHPDVAALPDGGFVLTWSSDGQDGSGLGIYAQRFDASGNPISVTQLIGDAGNNVIAWSGTDGVKLDGGAGADSLRGGTGDDRFVVDNAGDVVTESPSAGTDQVDSSVSFTLPSNVENLTFTGAGAINGTGNALDNVLTGNSAANLLDGGAGNDTLIGGGGTDTLVGGAGNDVFFVDSANDVVIEAVNGGTDTVHSSASHTLSSTLENLVLTGGAPNGTGNSANNTLTGNSADNILTGGAGDDVLDGGDGNDTAVFNGSSASYTFRLGGGGVVVTDTDTITGGNDGADTLIGIEAAEFTDGTVRIIGSLTEFRVNTTTADEQGVASVAALSDGGFVVTWQSFLLDGSNSEIYAQRYDASGAAAGVEFRVNTTAASWQTEPRVAALSDGGFVVTWQSYLQDGSLYGIYAQRYDASGAAVDAEFRVNTATENGQYHTAVAALSDGGFVVTWSSEGQDGSGYGIYAQRYDAGGAAAGAEFRVNTTTAGSQDYSAVAALSDGGFVVTWGPGGDSPGGVHAQRYDAGGAAVGSEFQVNTTSANWENYADIAALSDGGFVVTWNSDGQDGSGTGVYAQRYDASGVASGAEFRVNTTTANAQATQHIAALSDGGFVVAWISQGQDGSGYGIYAQRYDAGGAAAGGEFRVNTTTANDQYTPFVAALADGGFVVTWHSNLQDGSSYGVYAQRYDAQGVPIARELTKTIQGTDESEFIVGVSGNDTLHGAGGNDTIDGGTGDNLLHGDAGADLALLPGTLADYALSILSPGSGGQTFYDPGFGLQPGDIVNIVNQSGRIDRLAGVEKVRFVGDPDTSADDVEFALTPQGLLASAEVNFGENYIADSNGTGSLLGGAGNDVLDGLDGDDTLEGASGNDVLLGGNGNDSLAGGEGNDALNGQGGDDTLVGGAGNDNYIVDSAGDQIVEAPGEGSADRVQTVLALYSLEELPEVEILQFTGEGDFHGIGNAGANTLIGGVGADSLEGAADDDALIGAGGNDTLAGGDGNDTLDGGTGNDLVSLSGNREDYAFEGLLSAATATHGGSGELDQLLNVERVRFGNGEEASLGELLGVITGTDGNDTRVGTAGNDYLSGGLGNDSLLGGAGDDTLDGGAGKDTLVGGAGNDTYVVDMAGETVSETLTLAQSGGVDTVRSAVSYALGANLDNLVLLDGAGNLNGTGNGLANVLSGNDGNNSLSGGLGADLYVASAGNDIYVLADAGDSIEASGGDAGIDTARVGSASGTPGGYLDLSDKNWLENVVYTGTGGVAITGNDAANALTGNAGNDTLEGGEGNDTLDGGAGSDSMAGGPGNDTYVVNAVGDAVTEAPGDSGDVLLINRTVTLTGQFAEIEHVTLTGTALNATGNDAPNALTGNGSNNSLSGGAGADTLSGGAGNDTLVGGPGDDQMQGGPGNDVYELDSAGDVALETIAAGGGSDLVRSWVDATLGANLERLLLLGNADLSGTGNALNNTLTGNIGNNTLDGGAGADTMSGGLGNDVYYVNQAGETVTEAANAGTDAVQLGANISYALPSNVENLVMLGSGNTTITGNGLNNQITGGAGNNKLVGGAGNDTLEGGAGNDTLEGGAGNDTYTVDAGEVTTLIEASSSGTDTVRSEASYTLANNFEHLVLLGGDDLSGTGNSAANAITGNSGDNTLDGSAGNDTLTGGAGNDSLQGGAGNDAVLFSGQQSDYTVAESSPGVVILAGPDGTDTVSGAETFKFGDQSAISLAQLLDSIVVESMPEYALDALLSGRYWAHTPGVTLELDFSFMTAAPSYADPQEQSTFAAMTAEQMDAVRDALDLYETLLDVDFTEVADSDSGVDLRFGRSEQASAGYAYLPGDVGLPAQPGDNEAEGDVWINSGLDEFQSGLAPGEQLWGTLLHEIGHALGLKHPFEEPSLADAGHGNQDNDRYTLMSYTSRPDSLVIEPTGDESEYEWRPETPMLFDVGALQSLYGTNALAADDTHVLPADRPFFMTLWDSGGDDTLDASGFASDSAIDLREGHFSSIGRFGFSDDGVWLEEIPPWYVGTQPTYGGDNLAIAYGAVIENATGGAGNDTLIGNDAANSLSGGDGDDELSGGAGADRFVFDSLSGVDSVLDFASAADLLAFDDAVFAQVGAEGPLAASALRQGAGATQGGDADDRIVFDTATGNLYYDADGSDAAPSLQVAQLAGVSAIEASDIVVA